MEIVVALKEREKFLILENNNFNNLLECFFGKYEEFFVRSGNYLTFSSKSKF